MNPVDKGWGDVKVLEFLDYQVGLDGIECRTEVSEEWSGVVARGFQVWLEEVEVACHSILCSSPGLAGKLIYVNLQIDKRGQSFEDELFQAFHYYGGKCNWARVVMRRRASWVLV